MFVQSHIQRTRHQHAPASSTTANSSATAAAAAHHHHHNHHPPHHQTAAHNHHNQHHNNHNNYHHRQHPNHYNHHNHSSHHQAHSHSSSAKTIVGAPKSKLNEHRNAAQTNSSEQKKAQQEANGNKTPQTTSAFGVQSNRHNSFFGNQFDQDDVVQALNELDKSGELFERISGARTEAELLEQVELVESQLLAKRRTKQHQKQRALQKLELTVERRETLVTKSISLIDLNAIDRGLNAENLSQNREASSLRQRAQTINRQAERQHSAAFAKLAVDQWTQVSASLNQVNLEPDSSGELRETNTQVDRSDPSNLQPNSGGVADEQPTRSGVSLRLKFRQAIGWFWVNFFAYHYETFRQIYRILLADLRSQNCSMATLRAEYFAAAVPPASLHLADQAAHELLPVCNHSHAPAVHLPSYANQYNQQAIALANSIEPRPHEFNYHEKHLNHAHYYDHHQHQHHQHQLNHNHHNHHQSLANHVHRHNHTQLTNYCASLECALHQTIAHRDTSAPPPPPFNVASERVPTIVYNQQARGNPVAARHEQRLIETDRHLRHTIDGSPIRGPSERRIQAALAAMKCPKHVTCDHIQRPVRLETNQLVSGRKLPARALVNQRASLSSPTLLEASASFGGAGGRHHEANDDGRSVRKPHIANGGFGGARVCQQQQQQAKKRDAVGERVEWTLSQSSDELSVISDHEPADRPAAPTNGNQNQTSDQHQQAFQLVHNRRRLAGLLAAGQSSSIDSEEPANRLRHRTADYLTARSARFVKQASLNTQHTSSISGRSSSPATSSLNHLTTCAGGGPDSRGGAIGCGGSSGGSGANCPQQQQTPPSSLVGGRKKATERAGPLAKVSLAGAKRRLGFKRRGGGLNSLSVHRSEEVFPSEASSALLAGAARRHLFATERTNTTNSSSLNDSSCELDLLGLAPAGSTAGQALNSSHSRLPWLVNQLRNSPDPKICFVDGLGQGQIASRQALVSPYLGDIQLGLSDRRGMLEVEVIRVRQLQPKPAAKRLPSPYVKVYLMRDKKCLAKFKTTQAHETLDPLYQQQFIFRDDYSNCVLQVIVWADYGKKDRKSLMGAVQIFIDDLDMSELVIGWYKLFNAPSMANTSTSKALRQTMSSSRLASDLQSAPTTSGELQAATTAPAAAK